MIHKGRAVDAPLEVMGREGNSWLRSADVTQKFAAAAHISAFSLELTQSILLPLFSFHCYSGQSLEKSSTACVMHPEIHAGNRLEAIVFRENRRIDKEATPRRYSRIFVNLQNSTRKNRKNSGTSPD